MPVPLLFSSQFFVALISLPTLGCVAPRGESSSSASPSRVTDWPYYSLMRELSTDVFDSRTPTGTHYFEIIYCLTEQHERNTASSHVRDFLSNTSTHAHWLPCRNGDFWLTSVNQKRLCLGSLSGKFCSRVTEYHDLHQRIPAPTVTPTRPASTAGVCATAVFMATAWRVLVRFSHSLDSSLVFPFGTPLMHIPVFLTYLLATNKSYS